MIFRFPLWNSSDKKLEKLTPKMGENEIASRSSENNSH